VLAFLDRIFGLPAHPLLVHVPVVLVPLSALALVGVAVRPGWRAAAGWWVVGLAFVALVSVQLAMTTGESLQEHVGDRVLVHQHASLAEPMRPLALAVLLLSVGLVLVDRRRARAWYRNTMLAVGGVSIVVAAASMVQVARVGHSGAKAVWHDKGTSGPGGDDDRGQ